MHPEVGFYQNDQRRLVMLCFESNIEPPLHAHLLTPNVLQKKINVKYERMFSVNKISG